MSEQIKPNFDFSLIDRANQEIEKLKESDSINKYLIDLSSDIQEPIPLIKLSDTPVFTRGNISCISGKAKSRKTFLISLLSAQFLEQEDNLSVVIYDTEMSLFHTAKTAKRIHRLLEWDDNKNNERLKVFCLRELTAKERLDFIKLSIDALKPDLIFVDGLRDLMLDFNNLAESSEIVTLLMQLSSRLNCHICVVLHENKGSDTLRGHAGTEVQNKSETVVGVSLEDDVSCVSPKYCRNIPFEKFYFQINENGLPEYCEPRMKPKNTDKLAELFNEVMSFGNTYTRSDLINKIMPVANVKFDMAKKKIKKAIDDNIIIKNKVGYYHLPHEQNNEDEMPF